MLDISSQIFYTKATNLMSGSGKALINIIYECCLIQLQRPRNQNKQIFEGFADTERQQPREKGAKTFKIWSPPLSQATIRRAIRLLSSSSSVQAGFLPGKAGKAWARGGGRKRSGLRSRGAPAPPTVTCGPAAQDCGVHSCWGPLPAAPEHRLGVRIAWDCVRSPVMFHGVYVSIYIHI